MPDEPQPDDNWIMRSKGYTGPRKTQGGQFKTSGSRVVAFETGKQFTYVAGDATKTYRAEKAKKVTRQFLFLMPDVFVVFDRIIATDPSYRTEWLIHTANRPVKFKSDKIADSNVYKAIHDKGQIFVRTLLPESPRFIIQKGFKWADGTEAPIKSWDKMSPEEQKMQGEWCLKISPGKQKDMVEFLNILQVGKKDAPLLIPAKLRQTVETNTVYLSMNNCLYEIGFKRLGNLGGYIKITDSQNGKVKEYKFTTSIAPQKLVIDDFPDKLTKAESFQEGAKK
jgi:heparin/heparan-sulfate lyase